MDCGGTGTWTRALMFRTPNPDGVLPLMLSMHGGEAVYLNPRPPQLSLQTLLGPCEMGARAGSLGYFLLGPLLLMRSPDNVPGKRNPTCRHHSGFRCQRWTQDKEQEQFIWTRYFQPERRWRRQATPERRVEKNVNGAFHAVLSNHYF